MTTPRAAATDAATAATPDAPTADWRLFTGDGRPHPLDPRRLPPPPPWRAFTGRELPAAELRPVPAAEGEDPRGATYQPDPDGDQVRLVNAALYLRRPLLITGKPGTGKSSLAYAVAHELGLGPVLRWSITSRSTLAEGLYQYDAIGRLQEPKEADGRPADIGRFIRLGPLGTALLPSERPRVLLIDEIDKSDIDLPNDLLNVFEEGEYPIPELVRLSSRGAPGAGAAVDEVWVFPADGEERVRIAGGRVRCHGPAFPFVVLTSNGERDFPPPFLRRCLRLDLKEPDDAQLRRIVQAHLHQMLGRDKHRHAKVKKLIEAFLAQRAKGDLANDQLLNAVFLTVGMPERMQKRAERDRLVAELFRLLTPTA